MATIADSASVQKSVQIIHPTRTKTKSDPLLDFSFLNISSPKGKFQMKVVTDCIVCIYLSSIALVSTV